MNKNINIIEVGPRDGFQNLKEYIPLETKRKVIDGIISAGLRSVQITSFVSPKAIPQMRDAEELARRCLESYPDLDLFALVPNLRGAEIASELGMKRVSYVISLSQSHNLANIKSTHQQSFDGLDKIRDAFPELNLCVDVATAFGCPFEGTPAVERVFEFVGKILEHGIHTIALCDTIGSANPAQVRDIVTGVLRYFPSCEFQLHVHDTRGMGLANTLAAIESGISSVQSALGGLGGCPFAPGASGNIATEDLVFMLNAMGYSTGVDYGNLLEISKEQHNLIPGNYSGHHLHISSNCEL